MSKASFNVRFKVTQYFFDRAAVQAAMDKATHKSLYRAAMRIKVFAQRSMRRRKKGSSKPGSPPFAKKGTLRKLLIGAFDPGGKSMVVGPDAVGPAVVPGILERGGTETLMRFAPQGTREAHSDAQAAAYRKLILAGVIVPTKRQAKKAVVAKYKARPYMGPALDKNIDYLPESFQGSVKS